jgi:DNA-binding transcriptional LysR family regulator
MELRHLRSFLSLADELHFGRAAERLGIAQPPLSRHIQQLEAEIGVRLVERGAREVKLTRAGEILRDRVRPQVEGILASVAEARAVGAGWQGRLRVGFITNMSYVFLPRVLAHLRANAPDAVFDVQETSVSDAERGVREERFDLALTRLPVEDLGLMQRALHEERLLLVLPVHHPLVEREEIALADVVDEPFVMCQRPEGAPLQHVIMRRCDEAGFHPRVVQEVGGKTLMMELVAAGMGLTLAPESSSYSTRPGLVYRRVVDPITPITMAAIWRRENVNPLRRIFIDAAAEVARGLKTELARRGAPVPRQIAAGE